MTYGIFMDAWDLHGRTNSSHAQELGFVASGLASDAASGSPLKNALEAFRFTLG